MAPGKKRTAKKDTGKVKRRASSSGGKKADARTDDLFLCTGCGLWAWAEINREDPRFRPRREPVGKARGKCWRECPAEGPHLGIFADPDDPTTARHRAAFSYRGKPVHVCTPYVKKTTGRGEISFGPLLRLDHLISEWHLRNRLDSRGPAKDIDVGLLPPTSSLPLQKVGGWVVQVTGQRTRYDEWAYKARRLFYDSGREPELDDLDEQLRPDPWSANPQQNHLLFPFDLRVPIPDQLKEAGRKLRDAQDYLHRLCQTPLPAPPRVTDTWWRDLYIYLLKTQEGLNATQIAAEVFPVEDRLEAALKVRRSLSKVRARLARRRESS